MPSRRDAVGGLLAGATLLSLARGGAARVSTPSAQLAEDIAAWDALGVHRTGTDVDARTADWLRESAERLGAAARLESFPFRRRTPVAASLTLPDGRTLEGVPLFDGGATPDGPLTARLGDDDDAIPVLRVPPFDSLPGARALHEARRGGRHPAIVAVTDERFVTPGLALLNAESFHAPFGPPVLQLASEHLTTLEALAGEQVHLDVRFEIETVTASNVRAEVRGRDPTLAPVVVITPRSSWWHSTSERGGGIALWLDLLRMLRTTPPLRTVIFSANTGHELGHVGMQRFLDENEALVADAHAWIHLGANFAASLHPAVRLQASDEALMTLADDALARHRASPMARTELGSPPLGEARDIHAGGGRYVSILGGNGAFHHPADRWPDFVDLQRSADIARALREVLGELALR
jgi:hypothetical protein